MAKMFRFKSLDIKFTKNTKSFKDVPQLKFYFENNYLRSFHFILKKPCCFQIIFKLLLWTIQTQVTDCSCIHIIPCVVNELLWEETWGRWISVPWIIQMIKRRSDGEVLFRQLAIHRLSSKYHFTEKYKGETLQKHRVLNILYTQGDFYFSISINTQKASHALKLNAI